MIKFILLLALAACSKPDLPPPPDCEKVCLLSDKYSLPDTMHIRTDTIWKDDRLCGRWLDSIRIANQTAFCNTAGQYEILRYVIGNKITHHKQFK